MCVWFVTFQIFNLLYVVVAMTHVMRNYNGLPKKKNGEDALSKSRKLKLSIQLFLSFLTGINKLPNHEN